MIGEEAIGLTEKILGGVAALGASFYLVERAIRFNVDLTDRYRAEIERLEKKIDELEKREADHLAKIETLEGQVGRMESEIRTLRATTIKKSAPTVGPVGGSAGQS